MGYGYILPSNYLSKTVVFSFDYLIISTRFPRNINIKRFADSFFISSFFKEALAFDTRKKKRDFKNTIIGVIDFRFYYLRPRSGKDLETFEGYEELSRLIIIFLILERGTAGPKRFIIRSSFSPSAALMVSTYSISLSKII